MRRPAALPLAKRLPRERAVAAVMAPVVVTPAAQREGPR